MPISRRSPTWCIHQVYTISSFFPPTVAGILVTAILAVLHVVTDHSVGDTLALLCRCSRDHRVVPRASEKKVQTRRRKCLSANASLVAPVFAVFPAVTDVFF